MPYLAFDIETAVADDAEAFYAKKEYKPDPALNDVDDIPSKILDLKTPDLKAQRILEWQTAQKHKLEQSVLQQKQKDLDQAPLRWWTGKVICVAVIDSQGGTHTFSHPDEKTLLEDFFDYLEIGEPNGELVGKRSLDFDIPFVVGRAMRHDLGLPRHLRLAREPIRDIELIWGGRNGGQCTSLDNICWGLGMPPKQMAGSAVADLYRKIQLGDQEAQFQLLQYNVDDAMKVYEILRRYKKPYTSRYGEKYTLSPDSPLKEETELKIFLEGQVK